MEIAGIDDGLVTLAGDDRQQVALSMLRQLQPQANPKPAAENKQAAITVELVGGGRIFADDLRLENDRFELAWQYGRLPLLIDAVRAIRLRPRSAHPPLKEALAEETEEDRFFVEVDDSLESIAGFLLEIDEAEVHLEWKGRERALPRTSVYGIVVAAIAPPVTPPLRCRLDLRDGSSLWALPQFLPHPAESPRELAVEVGGHRISLPWQDVVRIAVVSDRLQFLSDLEPSDLRQQPIVAPRRFWQRDRNVTGAPLSLDGRRYEKGLGVASGTELTFAIGQHDLFAATIGVDDQTGGRGKCIFAVLADGRLLCEHEMKRGTAPRELRLDVRGKQQLTLRVLPADDLDLGDHANWCDACLLTQDAL